MCFPLIKVCGTPEPDEWPANSNCIYTRGNGFYVSECVLKISEWIPNVQAVEKIYTFYV